MSTAKAQLEKLPRSIQFVLALGAIALAAFPLLPVEGGDFYLGMLSQMMILAIFAMSLDLLQGVTGLVSLGHAAFFGLAGYALAFVTPQDAPIALWWSLPLAAAAAGLAALVIGFFVVRTHGIYFIMVTMAFAQMVYFLFFDNKALGGSDGIYVTFRPDATALGIDLDNKLVFYYFTLVVLLALYFALRRLLFSPFGRVLAGIRVNEHRMRAVGYGTFGYKLTAFTLAGALAGVAGYLWAAQTGFVNPELMGFHMSAHAIMMVILGGMGNFAGAIVGAFAFEYVMHVFKDLTKHWQLLMGGFIVLVVIVAPRGLLGLVERFTKRGEKA
ncbi:branched-chain amino acid ABC transporter permease [Hydrogenophaga sp. YM1]|uniref:branched-chain amino acid ABC transporter permease n=1 Tax=Hydrogenophaga TaxID=47420 RepID=UPI000869B8FF|nr:MULTISPECIES: branched-chain amino acid ABC transporter permease [unclassified Hydrogenophaga]MBN9371695.1 branched-chain amino acid ABC transporter permease [Hydrogenophaga sp.]ODT29520.1 MAG: ABC transporter permease [Hydrogenophaga sp. SCN 70-13]OJV55184.1 MAG: branched-chain amino acid ABC transporter permease [Hydrogenophaga sp. 70-12]QRR32648.1 branched-chain amino acid ABC transporter permease [Hydrogenophaga sp. YM1]